MRRFLCSILLCLASVVPQTLFARDIDPLFSDTIDRTADDFVLASLCVAEPTNWRDDVLGVYGHAFIRLQCPVFNLDYCFSYEGESVNDQLLKYFAGKLRMGMFAVPTQEYVEDYRKWNRAVHEYRLNLPPDAEQRLWQIMDGHVAEGGELTLDLKKRGCSSTAAQYVEKALSPQKIKYAKNPDNRTFRVPELLAESWTQATLDGHPFAEYCGDLVEAEPATWWNVWFDATAFVIFLSLVALIVAIFAIRHKRGNSR